MRRLCDFPAESSARTFGDAIYARGIENTVEFEDGVSTIWIHDDEQLDAAREEFQKFESDPAAFADDATKAADIRSAEAAKDRKRASRIITRERLGYDAAASRVVTPSFALIVLLCVTCTFLAGHFGIMPSAEGQFDKQMEGTRETWRNRLFISEPRQYTEDLLESLWQDYLVQPGVASQPRQVIDEGFYKLVKEYQVRLRWENALPEVRRGEVWRLITPIFIHFGLIHLIFNLMWLFNFGSFIERYFSTRYLILFIIVTAILSCVPQYFWSGPSFGGFSGVNYALFGFLWIRSKTDRTVAWQLQPGIVSQLMIWLVVCMTGGLGPVANTAHVAGLVAGAAWGGISGWWRSRRR